MQYQWTAYRWLYRSPLFIYCIPAPPASGQPSQIGFSASQIECKMFSHRNFNRFSFSINHLSTLIPVLMHPSTAHRYQLGKSCLRYPLNQTKIACSTWDLYGPPCKSLFSEPCNLNLNCPALYWPTKHFNCLGYLVSVHTLITHPLTCTSPCVN